MLTSQKITDLPHIKSYSDIKKINPTFFIISSRTSSHYKDLKFILKNFRNKKILIEKPVFEKYKKLNNLYNNNVFIGYNLRLHPVIKYAKAYLEKKCISCWCLLPFIFTRMEKEN